MDIFGVMKKMISIEPKPTEQVGYERQKKDGRTRTGFAKPKIGQMGNQNANRMMKEIEDEEMNVRPKAK